MTFPLRRIDQEAGLRMGLHVRAANENCTPAGCASQRAALMSPGRAAAWLRDTRLAGLTA